MKLTPLDIAFSRLIRSANCYECEYCGADLSNSQRQCHTSHVVTRSVRFLRHDPRNVACLCAKCHGTLEGRPLAHAEWFRSHRPDDHAFISANQWRLVKVDKETQHKMLKYFKFQQQMVDTVHADNYLEKVRVDPWDFERYDRESASK